MLTPSERRPTSTAGAGTHSPARRDGRDVRELLRLRGHLLAGADRALIEMYLEGGETIRRIATLAAVSPSSIARRLRAIMQRLADPTYATCLAHGDAFTRLELRIAKDYFVRGLSIAVICRQRQTSRHRVRTTIGRARTIAAQAQTAGRPKERTS